MFFYALYDGKRLTTATINTHNINFFKFFLRFRFTNNINMKYSLTFRYLNICNKTG